MKFPESVMNGMLNILGEPAELQLSGVTIKAIRVTFDANSLNEVGMLTDRPQALIKDSDLIGVNFKTITILVNGEVFRMSKPLPDGAGFTLVSLQR